MDDEAVKLMKQYGTVVVPTLVAPRAIYENPEELPYFMVKKARLVAKPHFASIQKLVQNGVPIAMGTDSGCPYDDFSHWVVNEMKMYQDAGMTPAQGQQPNNRLERCKRATTDNLRLSPVCVKIGRAHV